MSIYNYRLDKINTHMITYFFLSYLNLKNSFIFVLNNEIIIILLLILRYIIIVNKKFCKRKECN